jgi:diguanylate cyclase (GGDEF)-like protein
MVRQKDVRTSKRGPSNRVDDRRSRTVKDAEDQSGALVVIVDDIPRIAAQHGPTGLAEVLRIAGQRIRQALRADDFSAQWGSEELVVMLRNVSLDSAVEVGQRIRIAISQPITLHDGRSVVPTCSIGAAGGGPDQVELLVERARRALELAKDSGGNCVRRALPVEDRWTAGAALAGL